MICQIIVKSCRNKHYWPPAAFKQLNTMQKSYNERDSSSTNEFAFYLFWMKWKKNKTKTQKIIESMHFIDNTNK